MKHSLPAIACVALACLQMQPATAWVRGGYTGGGGRWGAGASDGHWAAGADGHYGSGTYGTTSGGTHYATTSRGGSAEASNGSWSSTSASGHSNSGSYGTTAYGTHYATGSYGGAVATNNGHWAGESNGQYAYGSHYEGGATYAGAYHPPAVVNQYYGTGCYNCGGWGGAAAGVAVGAAVVGVANANANAAAANANAAAANANAAAVRAGYVVGDVYAALPAGCAYNPIGGSAYYSCGGSWFSPYYGANGMYYRAIPAP
jgi:hypothetical protein